MKVPKTAAFITLAVVLLAGVLLLVVYPALNQNADPFAPQDAIVTPVPQRQTSVPYTEEAIKLYLSQSGYDLTEVERLMSEGVPEINQEDAKGYLEDYVTTYVLEVIRAEKMARERERGQTWRGIPVQLAITTRQIGIWSMASADQPSNRLAFLESGAKVWSTGERDGDYERVVYYPSPNRPIEGWILSSRLNIYENDNFEPLAALESKRFQIPGSKNEYTLAVMRANRVRINTTQDRFTGEFLEHGQPYLLQDAQDRMQGTVWVFDLGGKLIGWSNYADQEKQFFILNREKLDPLEKDAFDRAVTILLAAGFVDISAVEEAERLKAATEAGMTELMGVIQGSIKPYEEGIIARNAELASLLRHSQGLESDRSTVAYATLQINQFEELLYRAEELNDAEILVKARALLTRGHDYQTAVAVGDTSAIDGNALVRDYLDLESEITGKENERIVMTWTTLAP